MFFFQTVVFGTASKEADGTPSAKAADYILKFIALLAIVEAFPGFWPKQ